MPRDEAAVLDIPHAAQRALRFVAGMSREEFAADEKTRSAVLHQLMILDEAVKRISAEYRTAHPEIPWRLMAGTRAAVPTTAPGGRRAPPLRNAAGIRVLGDERERHPSSQAGAVGTNAVTSVCGKSSPL